jgi:hypothetical protein
MCAHSFFSTCTPQPSFSPQPLHLASSLCDVGAGGALNGVVSKGSGEARKQVCGALWGLVLGGGGEQSGVDAVEGLLGSDGEEGVKAGLEGLSAEVSGSEAKQRAYVERFGVKGLVGLLGHGSAGVQAKTCNALRFFAEDCASNRVAFLRGRAAYFLVGLFQSENTNALVKAPACATTWHFGEEIPEIKDFFR